MKRFNGFTPWLCLLLIAVATFMAMPDASVWATGLPADGTVHMPLLGAAGVVSIRGLFTPNAIVKYLKALPVLRSPVIDTVFDDRPQLGLPIIGRDDVNTVVRAMALTRRGAPSIPIAASTGQADFFEPFPIHPDVFVGAHDLNNLKLLGPASKEAWAQQKTDLLRRTIRETTEAMAAIAIHGTLSWPVQLEGGAFDTYEVAFGTPVPYAPDKLWDAADAKISHVMQQLQDIQEALQDNGYGGVIEWWAGKTAYAALLVLAEKVTTTAKVRVEISEKGIDVGGFLIKRRTEKHRNPQSGAMVPTVGDTDLLAVAMDAGHVMPYAALDDLDANLQPLPMFVKPLEKKNPSGVTLIGNSKPFPSPNMKGIAKATVTGG
jgi:hypothetical protein